MSSQRIANVNDAKNLLKGASLNTAASQIMVNSLNDTNLMGCMGADVDQLETDDVTLSSLILDASGSMQNVEQIVRDSFDELVQALKESKQSGSMLVSSRTFATKEKILHGFKKVEEIDKIDNQYVANGSSTALYDTLINAMSGIKSYSEQLKASGIRTKCIVVVFSDGEDNDSRHIAKDVKTISDELVKSEMFYLVYVGYGTDLDHIAAEVGFPNKMTTTKDASQIRKTMGLVSKSIIRASQTQIGKPNSFFS